MTQKRYTEIPKRQKCVNKEEPYIGGAEDIVDDSLGKPQSEVNQNRIEDIAAEVQRAQQAEGTLDGKIALEKQRAEGVESGLNNRLGTVEQLAEISIGGGDAQIATGADFTNPDATKRAKVTTVGAIIDGLNDGVYDVSKRNPSGGPNGDGKFTLEYILSNANTLIPTSWRHGGMTISFVDTSDNKYVQYRLMSDSFNTTVANWQGVDDEPTAGSDNLVKSRGIFSTINREVDKNLQWTAGYINTSGVIRDSGGSKFTQPFTLSKGEKVKIGTTNTDICIIGTTTANSLSVGDTVTVLKTTSSVSQFEEFEYTAYEDIKLVLCVTWADYELLIQAGYDTDKTLTIPSAIPDSEVTGNNIRFVRSNIEKKCILDINSYYETNQGVGNICPLTKVIDNSFCSSVINVKDGDGVIISGEGGGSPRLWAFLDSNRRILAVSEPSKTESNLFKIVPANAAYLVVNTIVSNNNPQYVISNVIDYIDNSVNNSIIKLSFVGTDYVPDHGIYWNTEFKKFYLITNSYNERIEISVEDGTMCYYKDCIYIYKNGDVKPIVDNTIFSRRGIAMGSFIVKSDTGELEEDASYVTFKIKVKGFDYINFYSTTFGGNYGIAFYDNSFSYISGIHTTITGKADYKIPNNAIWARYCCRVADADYNNIATLKLSSPKSVEYINKYDNYYRNLLNNQRAFTFDYITPFPIIQENTTDYTFRADQNPMTSYYNLYDGLVEDYPNYCSKIDCDSAAVESGITKPSYMDGYPIYMYKFEPPKFSKNKFNTPLKILINTGTHCEYMAIYDCYLMMKHICEDWNNHELLRELRFNVEFYIMPCSNPYGVQNQTRTNYNGVDINRNMPVADWREGGIGTENYTGPSAGSEYESKVLVYFINEIKPDIFIDHHSSFSNQGTLANGGGEFGWGDLSSSFFVDEWRHFGFDQTARLISGFPDLLPDMNQLNYSLIGLNSLYTESYTYRNGYKDVYAAEQGILAMTFETYQYNAWKDKVLYENEYKDANSPQIATIATNVFINFVGMICKTYAKKMNVIGGSLI